MLQEADLGYSSDMLISCKAGTPAILKFKRMAQHKKLKTFCFFMGFLN
jgi:hypothetical protein